MKRLEALQVLRDKKRSPIKALLALGRTGEGEDLKRIVPYTGHPERDVQLIANGTVSTIIRKIIVDTESSYSEESRQKLGTLLSRIDPAAVYQIKQKIRQYGRRSDLEAIRLIRYIDSDSPEELRQLVGSLLLSSDDKVRATAATVVGYFFDGEDKSVFTDLIADPDPRVRANTVEMIETLADERLYFLLFRLKNDPHNRVRANAIKALYKLGRKRVKNDLLQMLESGDHFMQASALWVVSELTLRDSLILLQCEMLRFSDSTMVAKQAKQALAILEDSDGAPKKEHL